MCGGYFIFDITNFLETRLCTTYFKYVCTMYVHYVCILYYFMFACLCLLVFCRLVFLFMYIYRLLFFILSGNYKPIHIH